MKTLFYSSLSMIAFSVLFMSFNAPTESKSVNIEQSNVHWKAYKVTGSHEGDLKLQSGSLVFEDDILIGGEVIIDMNSITCTDLEAGMGKEKLEGHLKSDDFFATEKYPEARLEITQVISRGTPGDYKVVGDITIKDKTESIKFNTVVTPGETASKAVASLTLDRTEFDVRYGSGSFFENLGDKTIYDEFELQVEIQF